MELDDLKSAWTQLDRGRGPGSTPTVSAVRDRELDRTRSSVGRLAWLLRYEIASGVLATLLVGSFLGDNWHALRFLIPALVLHEYAIISIVIAGRQHVLLSRVDFAGPVIALQRELTKLATFRIRATLGAFLLAPLLWTPLLIVAARGLFGVDVYRALGPAWLWANFGFGLAVIPIGLWLARRIANAGNRPARRGGFVDVLAGHSLAEAKRYADELVRFEAEA
jgi:hypothetical protein